LLNQNPWQNSPVVTRKWLAKPSKIRQRPLNGIDVVLKRMALTEYFRYLYPAMILFSRLCLKGSRVDYFGFKIFTGALDPWNS
jgi:hypothetical protein